MARMLVVAGKFGPAFTGTHSRFSKIGSRFDFQHLGEVDILNAGRKEGFWLFSRRAIPADIPESWSPAQFESLYSNLEQFWDFFGPVD